MARETRHCTARSKAHCDSQMHPCRQSEGQIKSSGTT